MSITRRVLAAFAVTAAAFTLGACSTRPPVDEVWLFYMNGSIDKKEFKACVAPNTKGPWAANNDLFALPTSARTWNVSPTGGDTNTPTVVGSKPDPGTGQAGPQVEFWTTTEFFLNTYCGPNNNDRNSPVVKFWEKFGSSKHLSDDAGEFNGKVWKEILINTLVSVQTKAEQRVARQWSADEQDTNTLYVDPKNPTPPADREVWRKMEDAMSLELGEQLKAKMGGEFFCGVGYDRSTGACPPVRISITDINYADKDLQAKRAAVRSAAEDAKKRLIEAKAKVDESNLLAHTASNPNYMELKRLETALAIAQQCAAAPQCTMVVTGGNPVNVGTK